MTTDKNSDSYSMGPRGDSDNSAHVPVQSGRQLKSAVENSTAESLVSKLKECQASRSSGYDGIDSLVSPSVDSTVMSISQPKYEYFVLESDTLRMHCPVT